MQTQKNPALAGPGYTQALGQLYGPNRTTTGNGLDRLLGRLEKVKQTGPGRYLACCPAHDDRSPSLSVRETEDGTILVKCWAGCGAADVIAAAGLQWSDLFPERTTHHRPLRPGERWVPRDVLKATAHEILVAISIAQMLKRGECLTDEAMVRLILAERRMTNAAKEVGCNV